MAPKQDASASLANPLPPGTPAPDVAAPDACAASTGPEANRAPAVVALVSSGAGSVAVAPLDRMEEDTTEYVEEVGPSVVVSLLLGAMDSVGARLGTYLPGWDCRPVQSVGWIVVQSWPRGYAARPVAYDGPGRKDVRAAFPADVTGSYVVPREVYCSCSTVPTAAAARYVVAMHEHLLSATVLSVAPILRKPSRTEVMCQVKLRQGVTELDGYCLLKAVHAMRAVSGLHINVRDYLKWRIDRSMGSHCGIRLAQEAVCRLLRIYVEQFPELPVPVRKLSLPFCVAWADFPVLRYFSGLEMEAESSVVGRRHPTDHAWEDRGEDWGVEDDTGQYHTKSGRYTDEYSSDRRG